MNGGAHSFAVHLIGNLRPRYPARSSLQVNRFVKPPETELSESHAKKTVADFREWRTKLPTVTSVMNQWLRLALFPGLSSDPLSHRMPPYPKLTTQTI